MASKSSIEAGRGHVTLGVQDDALTRGLAAAQGKFQSWGKGIAAIGAGIAAGAATITAPFLYGLSVFQDWGAEMRTGIRQTGIEFEQLDYLMDSMHVTIEELTPAVAHLSSFLEQAAHGSSEANRTLLELGLNLSDLLALNPGERMQRVAEAIGNIGDANQRIALQRGVFGRQGLALNLEGGAEGMQARAARRDYLEGQPTRADQEMASQTSKLFGEMGLAIKAIWREIGAAAAPVMQDFYRFVIRLAVGVREWIEQNRGLLTTIFRVADILVTVGFVIGGVGAAVYAASYAFAFLSGVVAITKTFMAGLWAVTVFVATGMGAATVAGWAWAAALFVVKGVMIVLNFAHAVGVAVLGLFTAGTVAATGASGAYTVSLIAAYIWENLVSAGLWLLVTALGAVAIAMLAVAAPIAILLPFLPFLILAAGAGYLFGDGIRDAATAIGVSLSDALQSAGAMFGNLWYAARTAIGGIMDAIKAGDWALAWEILKTAALVAWESITIFVRQQFIIWKTAAIEVWYSITASIEDTFHQAMVGIQMMFAETLALMLDGIAELLDLIPGMGDAAAAARSAAAGQRANSNQLIEDEVARQWDAWEERANEAYDRAIERANELAGIDTSALDTLSGELDLLRDVADAQAQIAALGSGGGFPGGGGDAFGAARASALVTFSAQALRYLGGARSQSDAERAAAQRATTNQILERIARLLEEQEGPAFA